MPLLDIKHKMRTNIPASRHFDLQELSEGVYAAVATADGWAVGNAGIVALGDHTLIFDTFANHLAAADLKVAAEHATDGTVDYVLISHGHRDHYKGNQIFRDADIVATRGTCEMMAQRWKNRSEKVKREGLDSVRKELEEEFENWKSAPATTETDKVLWESYKQSILQEIEAYNLKLPDVGFENTLMLYGLRRNAEAITYGGGHSVSDALLYLPEEGIAYLGDLLFIGYQPYVGEGNPEEWLRILDKVEALEAKVLVPGHGPVGTPGDIQPMRDYIVSLLETAGKVRNSGTGAKEAAESSIPPPFDTLKWRAFWKENLEFLLQRESNPTG